MQLSVYNLAKICCLLFVLYCLVIKVVQVNSSKRTDHGIQTVIPTIIITQTRMLYEKGHITPSKEICPNEGRGMKLLILVTTAPHHVNQRRAIRLTWGLFSSRSDIGLAFVVGTGKPEYKKIIDSENRVYGDIIQGFFTDTYFNLTLKTISMLEWSIEHCNQTKFVLKVDDDVFINLPILLQILDNPEHQSGVIIGRVTSADRPNRDPKSVGYISKEEYGEEFYPDFAHGPAYVMSNDVIKPLYDAALNSKFFKLEDVYVTGILVEKLKIRRKNCEAFALWDKYDMKKSAAIHDFMKPSKTILLWMKHLDEIMQLMNQQVEQTRWDELYL